MTTKFHLSARLDNATIMPHHAQYLEPGDYCVRLIEDNFVAWSAWSSASGPWLNKYHIWSPMFGTNMIQIGSDKRYESPQEAFQDANPYEFQVTHQSYVFIFAIVDSFHDNQGGLSLELSRI